MSGMFYRLGAGPGLSQIAGYDWCGKASALRSHQRLALHLPRQHQQGNRIRPSPKNAIERIDATRPGGDVDVSCLAGDARVNFRRHRAGLFVVVADGRDALCGRQRVIEKHSSPACDEKAVFDAPLTEALKDIVR